MTSTELGAYLKARRGHVQPHDVGLASQPGRRVPGLRREEVAMLAGVSVDYYGRLEQGREKNPSASVLNALSRALDLDQDSREHVFRLADLAPAPASVDGSRRVDQSLLELLNSWPLTPAMIINRQLDIVACNDLATALYSDFARVDNLVRMTFLDPAGSGFFTDWARASETCVANLRLALGHRGGHDKVLEIVNHTYSGSAEFRRLWGQGDVRGKTHESKSFQHSDVGELVLEYNAFDVKSAPGLQLIVYRAAADTFSFDKLQLLGALAATKSKAAFQA